LLFLLLPVVIAVALSMAERCSRRGGASNHAGVTGHHGCVRGIGILLWKLLPDSCAAQKKRLGSLPAA
jgi:hypothetical protein